MKRLIIHIGSPRTASTSIQKLLYEKVDLLRNESIYFGEYVDGKYAESCSHSNLLWAIADEIYTLLKIPPLYKISETAEEIAKKMMMNADLSSCETILLSCELFFYTIFDTHLKLKGIKVTNKKITKAFQYSINRFKELFEGFEVKIVCYLRRQDLLIESFFNQFVKESSPDFYKTINGANKSLLKKPAYDFKDDSKVTGFNYFLKAIFNYTDYHLILKEWAAAYGKECIILRIFEKNQLDGNIIEDFFKHALNISICINDVPIVNSSISRDKFEFLLRLQMRGFHSRIVGIPEYEKSDKPYNLYMSLAERNSLIAFHKKGNELIAREFLDRKDGILFYDEVRQEEDTYTGLSSEAIFHITRHLLMQ